MQHLHTFAKNEHLCSKILIDKLFSEGNKGISGFPVRVTWLTMPADALQDNQILIVAPKKKFHHAVDRNRVKRQLRELFRLHKQPLYDALASRNKHMALALVFSDDRLWSSDQLEPRIVRIIEKLTDSVLAD